MSNRNTDNNWTIGNYKTNRYGKGKNNTGLGYRNV